MTTNSTEQAIPNFQKDPSNPTSSPSENRRPVSTEANETEAEWPKPNQELLKSSDWPPTLRLTSNVTDSTGSGGNETDVLLSRKTKQHRNLPFHPSNISPLALDNQALRSPKLATHNSSAASLTSSPALAYHDSDLYNSSPSVQVNERELLHPHSTQLSNPNSNTNSDPNSDTNSNPRSNPQSNTHSTSSSNTNLDQFGLSPDSDDSQAPRALVIQQLLAQQQVLQRQLQQQLFLQEQELRQQQQQQLQPQPIVTVSQHPHFSELDARMHYSANNLRQRDENRHHRDYAKQLRKNFFPPFDIRDHSWCCSAAPTALRDTDLEVLVVPIGQTTPSSPPHPVSLSFSSVIASASKLFQSPAARTSPPSSSPLVGPLDMLKRGSPDSAILPSTVRFNIAASPSDPNSLPSRLSRTFPQYSSSTLSFFNLRLPRHLKDRIQRHLTEGPISKRKKLGTQPHTIKDKTVDEALRGLTMEETLATLSIHRAVFSHPKLRPNKNACYASVGAAMGNRKTMEDRHRVVFGKDATLRGFFGVFDGHRGDECAHMCATKFWAAIKKAAGQCLSPFPTDSRTLNGASGDLSVNDYVHNTAPSSGVGANNGVQRPLSSSPSMFSLQATAVINSYTSPSVPPSSTSSFVGDEPVSTTSTVLPPSLNSYQQLLPSAPVATSSGDKKSNDSITNPNLHSQALARHELKQMESIYEERFRRVILEAFRDVQHQLLQQCRMLDIRGGTCALLVMIVRTQIFCAWTGDSRAVLCRDGIAVPLSVDHKPWQPFEKQRVEDAGGHVHPTKPDAHAQHQSLHLTGAPVGETNTQSLTASSSTVRSFDQLLPLTSSNDSNSGLGLLTNAENSGGTILPSGCSQPSTTSSTDSGVFTDITALVPTKEAANTAVPDTSVNSQSSRPSRPSRPQSSRLPSQPSSWSCCCPIFGCLFGKPQVRHHRTRRDRDDFKRSSSRDNGARPDRHPELHAMNTMAVRPPTELERNNEHISILTRASGDDSNLTDSGSSVESGVDETVSGSASGSDESSVRAPGNKNKSQVDGNSVTAGVSATKSAFSDRVSSTGTIQRIWPGGFSISRALGNMHYTDATSTARKTNNPDILSTRPSMTCTSLQPNDSFVIIATDGLWDVVNSTDAVQWVLRHSKRPDFDPQTIGSKMAAWAISQGSDDNVTVIIVFFTHHPPIAHLSIQTPSRVE